MENRNSYEQMLEAQCQNHGRLLHLLQKIGEYDQCLFSEASKSTPDTSAIEYCNIQKNKVISQLDALSREIVNLQIFIEEAAESFLDGSTHPLYIKLSQLRKITSEEFRQVLHDEDMKNPHLYKNLSAYRERLELDLKIKEVPQSKRQVFYMRI